MKRTPLIHIYLSIAFIFNSLGPFPTAQADEFYLPAPGTMVPLSPVLNPPILRGIKIHSNNPFLFDFILEQGDSSAHLSSPNALVGDPQQEQLKTEATKLIKYFLASLTIPENDLWVNLSPYEKNRIIPSSFGLTEMGRDLLAEDYMLKQITASLIYPEGVIGKKFWKKIYVEAAKKFGTTNIPVSTFNKVWIVPDKAVVYENAKAGTAYVVESKLKVMLEEDYLALQKQLPLTPSLTKEGVRGSSESINTLGSQIIREIVIPELTKEVNLDKNFSQLRQVYNSLILATWYKKKIKDSILEQVYADRNKINGVEYNSTVIPKLSSVIPAKAGIQNDVELIYQRYLQAFKKGVFNYIKEDSTFPPTGGDGQGGVRIPRKYFSGGENLIPIAKAIKFTKDGSMVSNLDHAIFIQVRINQLSGHADQQRAVKTVRKDKALLIPDSGESEGFLNRILDVTRKGQGEYLQRFVQGVNEGTEPGVSKEGRENPGFAPRWSPKEEKNIEDKAKAVIAGNLVQLPDPDGKLAYWIVRRIKDVDRKNINSFKFEKLVQILGKEFGADYAPVRELSSDEWAALKLPDQNTDYYLVRAVEKDNWHGESPPKKRSAAYCSLIMTGLVFQKFDPTPWNAGYLDTAEGYTPIGIDSDMIFDERLDEDTYFLDLVTNFILNIAETVDSHDPQVQEEFSRIKNDMWSGKIGVEEVGRELRRFGLGQGIIKAEGLNLAEMADAARQIKSVSSEKIVQAVHEAGFEGTMAEYLIDKINFAKFSLGRIADRYWQMLSGEKGGLTQLDYPISKEFAALPMSFWDISKDEIKKALLATRSDSRQEVIIVTDYILAEDLRIFGLIATEEQVRQRLWRLAVAGYAKAIDDANGERFEIPIRHLTDPHPPYAPLDREMKSKNEPTNVSMTTDALVGADGKLNLGRFEEVFHDAARDANKTMSDRHQIVMNMEVNIAGGNRYLFPKEAQDPARKDMDLIFYDKDHHHVSMNEYYVIFRQALEEELSKFEGYEKKQLEMTFQSLNVVEIKRHSSMGAPVLVQVKFDPHVAPFPSEAAGTHDTAEEYLLQRIMMTLENYLDTSDSGYSGYVYDALKDYLEAEYYLGDLLLWEKAKKQFLSTGKDDAPALANLFREHRQRVVQLFETIGHGQEADSLSLIGQRLRKPLKELQAQQADDKEMASKLESKDLSMFSAPNTDGMITLGVTGNGRDDANDDLVARDLERRGIKHGIVVDLGIGFPPVTTAHLAKTLGLAHRVIGVDLNIPDYVLEFSHGFDQYTAFFEIDRGSNGKSIHCLTFIEKKLNGTNGDFEYQEISDSEMIKLREITINIRNVMFVKQLGWAADFSKLQDVVLKQDGARITFKPLHHYEINYPNLSFIKGGFTLGKIQGLVDTIRVMNTAGSYTPRQFRDAIVAMGKKEKDGGVIFVGGNADCVRFRRIMGQMVATELLLRLEIEHTLLSGKHWNLFADEKTVNSKSHNEWSLMPGFLPEHASIINRYNEVLKAVIKSSDDLKVRYFLQKRQLDLDEEPFAQIIFERMRSYLPKGAYIDRKEFIHIPLRNVREVDFDREMESQVKPASLLSLPGEVSAQVHPRVLGFGTVQGQDGRSYAVHASESIEQDKQHKVYKLRFDFSIGNAEASFNNNRIVTMTLSPDTKIWVIDRFQPFSLSDSGKAILGGTGMADLILKYMIKAVRLSHRDLEAWNGFDFRAMGLFLRMAEQKQAWPLKARIGDQVYNLDEILERIYDNDIIGKVALRQAGSGFAFKEVELKALGQNRYRIVHVTHDDWKDFQETEIFISPDGTLWDGSHRLGSVAYVGKLISFLPGWRDFEMGSKPNDLAMDSVMNPLEQELDQMNRPYYLSYEDLRNIFLEGPFQHPFHFTFRNQHNPPREGRIILGDRSKFRLEFDEQTGEPEYKARFQLDDGGTDIKSEDISMIQWSPTPQEEMHMASHDGVYLLSNENIDVSEEFFTSRKAAEGSVDIGFGGWVNLDTIAAREISYGIIMDSTSVLVDVLKGMRPLIEEANNREDFINRLEAIIKRGQYPYLSWDPKQIAKIRNELQRTGSWLSNDKAFDYIKRMLRENRLLFIRADGRDRKVFEVIQKWLKTNRFFVDTCNILNIREWLKDLRGGWGDQRDLEDFNDNLALVLNKKTVLYQSHEVRGDPSEDQRLQQRRLDLVAADQYFSRMTLEGPSGPKDLEMASKPNDEAMNVLVEGDGLEAFKYVGEVFRLRAPIERAVVLIDAQGRRYQMRAKYHLAPDGQSVFFDLFYQRTEPIVEINYHLGNNSTPVALIEEAQLGLAGLADLGFYKAILRETMAGIPVIRSSNINNKIMQNTIRKTYDSYRVAHSLLRISILGRSRPDGYILTTGKGNFFAFYFSLYGEQGENIRYLFGEAVKAEVAWNPTPADYRIRVEERSSARIIYPDSSSILDLRERLIRTRKILVSSRVALYDNELMLTAIDRQVERLGELAKLADREMAVKVAPDMASKAILGVHQGPGGIDLRPANMNLQTKVMDSRFRGNDMVGSGDDKGMVARGDIGIGIKFHLDAAMLAQLKSASGFVPEIIHWEPLSNVRSFLGIDQQKA